MRRERGELVRVRLEGQTRQLCYLRRRALAEFRMRVEPCADRRAAYSQIIESGEDDSEPFYIALDKAGPAGHLLPDSQGRCVLQVCARDLDRGARRLAFASIASGGCEGWGRSVFVCSAGGRWIAVGN